MIVERESSTKIRLLSSCSSPIIALYCSNSRYFNSKIRKSFFNEGNHFNTFFKCMQIYFAVSHYFFYRPSYTNPKFILYLKHFIYFYIIVSTIYLGTFGIPQVIQIILKLFKLILDYLRYLLLLYNVQHLMLYLYFKIRTPSRKNRCNSRDVKVLNALQHYKALILSRLLLLMYNWYALTAEI